MRAKDIAGIALSCAALSASVPVFAPHGGWWALAASGVLFIGWFAATVYALVKYRWRGCWSLLGLPFALFGPFLSYAFIGIEYACRVKHDCI